MYQHSDEASGMGGSITIDGKGNTTVAGTFRNATFASVSGNLHDPKSFGNLALNDNFNNDLNQNLAMGKADANLKAATSKLNQGQGKIDSQGTAQERAVLKDKNASAEDKHNVRKGIAERIGANTSDTSSSTWLGRVAQDAVGNLLGSTRLGASDSRGFIDKNGEYVQRSCFTAGTLIRTKEGFKPIEKIEIGDYVLSLDLKTGELSYKRDSKLISKGCEPPIQHKIMKVVFQLL